MTERPALVAQKCLNLYRQAHVIIGGWAAVNDVFVKEVDDIVLAEIEKLPCGDKLAEHIENLKSGKTPMTSVEPELLPYGGAMAATIGMPDKLTPADLADLRDVLENFVSDDTHLAQLKGVNLVKNFGPEWLVGIAAALVPYPDLAEKWKLVQKTDRAYMLWDTAHMIINNPITDRERARVQSDLLEYETYLPMFGDAGRDLLTRLRTVVSTMEPK